MNTWEQHCKISYGTLFLPNIIVPWVIYIYAQIPEFIFFLASQEVALQNIITKELRSFIWENVNVYENASQRGISI